MTIKTIFGKDSRKQGDQALGAAILGLVVGDALGVPVEFNSRELLDRNPVTDMRAFGTHHQPAGTWSDDSSLALCLAQTLADGFSLEKLANGFKAWLFYNHWTPHGRVFDVGMATQEAIHKLAKGVSPEFSGGNSVMSNGNGSLMRILPLLWHIKDRPIEQRFAITQQVSSITHAHIRSVLACFYYLEFARLLAQKVEKVEAYHQTNTLVLDYWEKLFLSAAEIKEFERLTNGKVLDVPLGEISGSGYVVHTLEASVWCLLNSGNYSEAVLKAVNLGKDTDTTGAVTGGLAGLYFGMTSIPKDWLKQLARLGDIEVLIEKMEKRYEINLT